MKTMISKTYTLLVFATLIGMSCKKEQILQETSPPIAKAGADITVKLPADSVTLDGTGSYTSDGTVPTFAWTKISGPSSFILVTPDASITKVKNLVAGVYNFQLKVTGKNGGATKDTVQVILDNPLINQPPIANAGVDQTIVLPLNTINLDGRNSADPENNITGFTWTKISGPATFSIINGTAVQTQVTTLVQGVYQFELKVTDNANQSSKDTVQINVLPPLALVSCNNRPVINVRLIPIGSLSEARIGLVSATLNNKIYFAGGSTNGAYSSRVDIYDINTNSWTTADLSKPERQGMAVATVGNKILFAGGGDNDNGVVTSRVDIYNAANNTWSTAQLSKGREFLTATTLGNKVFFAGGGDWEPNLIGSRVVDIYDNATNTWLTASLSEGRMVILQPW